MLFVKSERLIQAEYIFTHLKYNILSYIKLELRVQT